MARSIFKLSEGAVCNRALHTLWDLDAKSSMALEASGEVVSNLNVVPPTYSISVGALSNLSKMSDTSLSWIMFGDEQYTPTYTAHDSKIIKYLNNLTEQQCQTLLVCLKSLFPRSLYDCVHQFPSPSRRINTILLEMPVKPDKLMSQQPQSRIFIHEADQVQEQLVRFVKSKYAVGLAHPADYWADLATALGVSLHWILGATTNLFCKHQAADEVFAYYTMLQMNEQAEVVCLIDKLVASSKHVNTFSLNSCISDLFRVNTNDFNKLPSSERNTWFYQNLSELLAANYDRNRFVLQELPSRIASAAEEQYCPRTNYDQLSSQKPRTSHFNIPPMIASIFCATHYENISCHQLVFGEPIRFELRPKERYLILSFSKSNHNSQQKLINQLRGKARSCNNPAFVIYERARGILAEQGRHIENEILIDQRYYRKHFPKEMLTEFRLGNIEPVVENPASTSLYGYYVALQTFVMLLCMRYELPMDYFILADYSRHVTLDHLPLNSSQSEFLSAYLRASTPAQNAVLAQLCASNLT